MQPCMLVTADVGNAVQPSNVQMLVSLTQQINRG